MRSIPVFLASLALAFAQAASAQDVPSRVARLAFTQGAVSVYQDPELGWDKAYVNTPVTSENSVWTDRGARAEVRVGGIAVRMDGETQLDVSRLDDNDFDAGVARGSVNVRVRYKEGDDHITFNTTQALFVLEGDGRYRLDVDEDRDQARLTVFSGHAQMESAQGRVPVEAGRMIVVSGGQYGIEQARVEEFDRWADARDRQWMDSNARNYVSYDMTGYEELDRNGSWAQDPDYGSVWYPTRVSAGWAPYRYGHWTYVRPWGWTWIDDASWGYAPSHYGRWVQVHDRWAWAPGYAVREHPVWAPAVVGFIGGAGFSVSVGANAAPVGWYPLAPWERYQPWYHVSNTYVTRVNHYVVDRRPSWYRGQGDDWRHLNRDRAVTVVNRDVFVSRRPVQNSVVRVAPEVIRTAPVVSGEAVSQRVLPQKNDLARFRQENRTNVNVAAPTVMRQRTQPGAPQVSAAAPQQQQQPQQVVRPEFHRRGSPPPVVAAPAVQQPHVSAPAPQAQQPQNPAARAQGQPQRAAQDAMQLQQQQAAETQRKREEAAQRATQDTARREQQQRQQQEQAQRQVQEQQQRAAETQRQQQDQAQRAARDEQQRQERATRDAQQQQQRQADQQRRQQEQAQRDAQQQQQQQQQTRAAQEAQQRQQQQAAETQRKREEAAQRAAQDDARRAQAQRQQQEQAQQRQAQEQQRAAQQQQQQQKQAEQQRQQQANPAARAEKKEEKKDDKKDKEKDKDKQ